MSIFASILVQNSSANINKKIDMKMTAREKLYKKSHDKIVLLMAQGYSLTKAREYVRAKTGLSPNTIIKITRDLSNCD